MYDLGPQLETDRLVLRMFAPEMAETFHRIWNDPAVMKYIDNFRPTLSESRGFMTRLVELWRERGFGQWAVELKEEGRVIGYVGFKYLDETPEVELLYGLDKPYWRKGYATEAARACLDYVFSETPLERIVAVARLENTGSWRVMEKLGMKREKIARYYNQDVVYYAIEKQG